MIEALYQEYLNGNEILKSTYSGKLSEVSAMMDQKLSDGEIAMEDLGKYEEAAAHAAFYAGFKAVFNLLTMAV